MARQFMVCKHLLLLLPRRPYGLLCWRQWQWLLRLKRCRLQGQLLQECLHRRCLLPCRMDLHLRESETGHQTALHGDIGGKEISKSPRAVLRVMEHSAMKF